MFVFPKNQYVSIHTSLHFQNQVSFPRLSYKELDYKKYKFYNKINFVSASGTIHDGPLSPYLFYITLYTTSHHTVRSFRKNCNKSISTRSLCIELSNRLETDAVETSPLFRVNILTNTGFQRRIYSSGALPAWNWKSSLYS